MGHLLVVMGPRKAIEEGLSKKEAKAMAKEAGPAAGHEWKTQLLNVQASSTTEMVDVNHLLSSPVIDISESSITMMYPYHAPAAIAVS